MIKKQYSKDGAVCTVTFTVPAEQADGRMSVCVAGDFNAWDEEAAVMKKNSNGGFETKIKLDSGREYRFRYLFDGIAWDNDWNADKYVPSPFAGVEDSVVIV